MCIYIYIHTQYLGVCLSAPQIADGATRPEDARGRNILAITVNITTSNHNTTNSSNDNDSTNSNHSNTTSATTTTTTTTTTNHTNSINIINKHNIIIISTIYSNWSNMNIIVYNDIGAQAGGAEGREAAPLLHQRAALS